MRYPMTAIIAQREYEFTDRDGTTTVTVSLGAPARFPDEPGGDWYCPYRVAGPRGEREFYAGGVDSLQTILMAISALRIDLADLKHHGALTLHGGSDLGMALVP